MLKLWEQKRLQCDCVSCLASGTNYHAIELSMLNMLHVYIHQHRRIMLPHVSVGAHGYKGVCI